MIRRMFVSMLGLLVVLGLAAGPQAQEVVKIGIVAPLSAPGGVETGQALVEGAKIAAEELNASGGLLGKKVDLVIGDTSGQPERRNQYYSSDQNGQLLAVLREPDSNQLFPALEVREPRPGGSGLDASHNRRGA